MISNRIKNMPFGGLYEIFAKTTAMESSGKRLIHMEIGRPDYISPTGAINAASDALNNGFVHYTEVQGIPELRKAISEKEQRRQGLSYDPQKEILVTAGACEAISSVFLGLFDSGDEVIIPGPFFSAYEEAALISQIEIKELTMSVKNGWAIDVEALENLFTEKTKGIMICSPNNPAGYILSKEDLEKISCFALAHDLIVISDETYDEFYYDEKPVSIASLNEMRERTFVIKSSSKTYAMTGWRIGYVMGPENELRYLNKIHQNLSTCATSFAQAGAVDAYRNGDEFIKGMVYEFKRRRDFFYDELKSIEGLEILKPKGAFYMFPYIGNFGKTGQEVCESLLDAGVVAVPGSFFGKSGTDYIRLAYCRDMDELAVAAKQIKFVFNGL